uniref:RUN and FYVE domain-containing protein 2 n=1 Tax=Rhodnius prolixus TaxID=13249 RepID=T1ID96_RHOPR
MLEDEVPGAQDTIYLCNFRVSVDGEWLCLKELQDVEMSIQDGFHDQSTPSPVDPPLLIARDPVVIERRNLVNISKLIVKELIETSLKYGRMLDSDHMPLQHFFIVLEHVLRHGLKPKKGLLGPKKELWDILQVVEKLTCEAQDITSSVRDLPTVRTQMGRARAWLRLALMQKKLADYLKLLIDHRDDILSEYFEQDALLMSDEAIVIVGLLVGLNVIDCNLCVKEEDLDCQQGVIDFSLYLRSSHHASISGTPEEELDLDNMTTVLDQKNYIEELNRHLNATVGNLQAKVESLTTTNALMKEDLAIAKKNIMHLTEENKNLKGNNKRDINSERTDEGGGKENTVEIELLRRELEAEKKKTAEVQEELRLQVSLKAEMEVAMKLLEKDIHDKQDTIVSLRRQLDDIKQINLEMYKKLQECETELTEKGEMVTRLQNKTIEIGKLLDGLINHSYFKLERDLFILKQARPCDLLSLFHNFKVYSFSIPKLVCNGSNKCSTLLDSAGTFLKSRMQLPVGELFEKVKVSLFLVVDNDVLEKESSLKHKTELISKLEAKTCAMTDTLQIMGDKQKEFEKDKSAVEQALLLATEAMKEDSSKAIQAEGELRKILERELVAEKKKVNELQQEVLDLKEVTKNYMTLQEEKYRLDEKCREQEETLEELGRHLSISKLQVSELKEEAGEAAALSATENSWASDDAVTNCKICRREFSLTRRKHHCRNCGAIFCNACSDNFMPIPPSTKQVRVCDECHVMLFAEYSVV